MKIAACLGQLTFKNPKDIKLVLTMKFYYRAPFKPNYSLRSREPYKKWTHFLITCIKWLALDILCLILDINFVELDILSSSGFAKPPFSWNEVEAAAAAEVRGMVCCWMVFSRSLTFSRVSNRPMDNEKNYTSWIRTVMSICALKSLAKTLKT